MLRDCEHVMEVLALIAILYWVYKKNEGFKGDPYGTGARFYQAMDNSSMGSGSNDYVSSGLDEAVLLGRR